MNIEEFVDKANTIIKNNEAQESSVDSRLKNEITVRRVRDYLNKGILQTPERKGKNLDFTDAHLEQLLAIRALQAQGLSDKTLTRSNITSTPDSISYGKSYYEVDSEPEPFIDKLQGNSEILDSARTTMAHNALFKTYEAKDNAPSAHSLMAQEAGIVNPATTLTTWPVKPTAQEIYSLNAVAPQSAQDLFAQYKKELQPPTDNRHNFGGVGACISSSKTERTSAQLQKSITGALSGSRVSSKSANTVAPDSMESSKTQEIKEHMAPIFSRHTLGRGSADIYINENALAQLTELDKTNMLENFQKIIFKKN